MKLTKATQQLICDLERAIGDECFNPNSRNGYTLEEGLEYRYPIWYINKDEKFLSTRSTIKDLKKDGINTMQYKFGSNHLYVGLGIWKALNILEEKYGLDFNELTKSKKK